MTRTWTVCRQYIPRQDGERRWDQALYRFKINRMVSDLGFMRSATPPGSTH